MTLRYCAGFEYDTTMQEWNPAVGSGSVGTTTGGRNGGRCAFITHSNSWIYGNADGGAAQATWIIGFAYQTTNVGVGDIIATIIGSDGTVHGSIFIDTSRRLSVLRGTGAATLATGTTVLTLGVWYFIELKYKIDSAVGTYELRINGAVEVSGTGANTRNGGVAASADHFSLNYPGTNTPSAHLWDDFYACDDQGSVNNGFLGDIRVQAVYPSGNGATSNMVGSDSDSTNNYLLVNEASSDGDSTYVQSATLNDKDTYAMGDITPTSGTVYAVKPILTVRKDDAGARSVATICRLSSTEVLSSDRALSTSYQHLWDIRETKPGGGAWSVSDVNAVEVGVKVTV
jgi:hypothetical protein